MGQGGFNLNVVNQQLQGSTFAPFIRRDEATSVEDNNIHQKKTDVVSKCVFEALPPVRRLYTLREDWDKGETTGALGALALTAVNLPEDLRDIGAGIEQTKAYLKGNPFKEAYNYKDFQHEFSFFRGTLLQRFVDRTKHPELAKFLLKLDVSLNRMNFGKKIMSCLGVEKDDFEEVKTFDKETNSWKLAKHVNGEQRYAYSYKGKPFGVMTARAMSRTTLIGLGVMALFELPKVFKASKKGDNFFEKGESTAKQTVKSGINVASITAGIAYGGAIGSKYGKCFGSLVGMGAGAVLGGIASKKLQEIIN